MEIGQKCLKGAWFGSQAWSNDILRYSIKCLKGEAFESSSVVILQVVLGFKRDLEYYGYWWQSKVLNYHIHRFQAKIGLQNPPLGDSDSRPRERERCP